MRERLQERVPEFNMSPDPGGRWNWLLGVLAIGVASATLLALTRRAVASDPPGEIARSEDDDAQRWEERLDDELIRADV